MSEKQIAENRRARHEYQLLERFEAGIVLTGTEVKSLRDGRTTMAQAYADVRDGEAWLHGLEISIYDQGGRENHEPVRPRKLLLHRREIDSLYGLVRDHFERTGSPRAQEILDVWDYYREQFWKIVPRSGPPPVAPLPDRSHAPDRSPEEAAPAARR